MSEVGYFLSICIPTFNRVEKLRRCIESVLPLIRDGEIEVCVSDNASQDSTAELLDQYTKDYPRFRFNRQASNDGIDVNMLAVARMSNAKYIYWIGDDDVVNLDEFKKVIEYLKVSDCDCLVDPLFTRERTGEFSDCFDFFTEYGMVGCRGCMHFSSVIVKREAVSCDQILRYIGTFHLYAGAVIDFLVACQQHRACKVMVWERDFVRLSSTDKSWKDEASDVFYRLIPRWWHLLPVEIRSNKKCQTSYRYYLADIMRHPRFLRAFRWRYVNDAPLQSILSIFVRVAIILKGRVFRRYGKKYKFYRVGPVRFAFRSSRARIKSLLLVK